MSRVSVVFLGAMLGVVIPSVVHAQPYVLPSCLDPVVISRSSYAPTMPCVPPVLPRVPPVLPLAPTDVPAWLRPTPAPIPPPLTWVPAYVPPVAVPPVMVAPVPVSPGIDPWIPLAVRPAVVPSPLDLMTQMLVLQQLAAARPHPPAAPAAVGVAPVPVPPDAPGDGWMSGFIKGVKPAK
jgi:hypothetical protein